MAFVTTSLKLLKVPNTKIYSVYLLLDNKLPHQKYSHIIATYTLSNTDSLTGLGSEGL